MSTFLSYPEWSKLYKDQAILNRAYDPVDNWLKRTNLFKMNCAIYAEWAEFLAEVEKLWKWYNPHAPEVDKSKAVFEMVDIVKFGIARVMGLEGRQSNLDWTFAHYDGRLSTVSLDDLEDDVVLEHLQVAFGRFIHPNVSPYDALAQLDHMIALTCRLFDITKETFLDAMDQKNARCHKRAQGGQMSGKDVKSSEQPLELNN